MSKSPVAFVIEHIDNCESCCAGNFCAEGIQLMHRGSEIAARLLCPVPEVPRPKAKA